MNWTLAEMARAVPGAQLQGDGQVRIARVCTDSRDVQPGDVFIALQGERFDAAAFVPQALQAGAVAYVMVEDRAAPVGASGLRVPDAKLALGQLALAWRQRIIGPLIAVAGSNGKTTVTQMLAAILSAWTGGHRLATQGNFNNDIGLPLTLLRWRPDMRAAVVELGMNHVGEMAYLSPMAAPTVALVNNAQREHQEFMQSVEAVARENGEVLRALQPGGVGVVPHGDVHVPIWREMAGSHRLMTFGDAAAADVHLRHCTWQRDAWRVTAGTPAGELGVELHVVGRHNVRNALAATACALAAGVPVADIAAGLSAFRAVGGRSRVVLLERADSTVTLIDDTYNANPDSVEALIDVLAELPGPRLLVLGDMGEVGDQGPQYHTDVGTYAARRGVDRLLTLGELARHAATGFGDSQAHAADLDALLQQVLPSVTTYSTIAVKGSRFMRMERVVQALQNANQPQGGVAC
ncbi:UDP-N-acetylmuramoylalanyl-D-glutamyl-2, 6-diaminopimelate--D-alanyl-D-alanine ligase [Comamonas serinivorans]|uniref:UDP-N-acetylmuramoyl-tripeptide--D-alanyl-D-alanine ligase n=2 Tax=Comamonas serinivorans TaxID=1082851 RepID=A0A1Y0ERG1_9BURK|nr:UDP-N-acetylmuramoylalanyl-D-glutamyl-2, 6-diaminopimelate--D-alanyl-D-alanine ligase [Comamonas serinivorans]